MLFYILFGLMVVVLIVIITAIAQPPTRWVEHYVARQQKSKFPAKKVPASIAATHIPDTPSASQSGDTDSQKSGSHPA
jgi:Tfp pilus assembly major pilin PilA